MAVGALFEKHGRVNEAVAAYRAAVDAGEGHVRGRLIRLLAAQGRLEDATQLVRDILQGQRPGGAAPAGTLG